MCNEISKGHLAGKNKRRRTREQSQKQKQPTDNLENSRKAYEREDLQVIKVGDVGNAKEFGAAVLQEQERGDDAEYRERPRRPGVEESTAHSHVEFYLFRD